MIIISCLDSTLHFNVFITTHMGALVRLWKGGTTFEQLGGTKMTVWQPFIPTWIAKSGEPLLQGRVRESVETDLMNRVAFT